MTIGDGLAILGVSIFGAVTIWSVIGMQYWTLKHRNDKQAEVMKVAMERGIEGWEWSE